MQKEYKWPAKHSTPVPKKKPVKKAKPVDYAVTVQGGATFHVSDASSRYHAGLLKDGFFHEGSWYPPHVIVRVDRRVP